MKTLILVPAFGCDGRLYGPLIAHLKELNCIVHIGHGASFAEMVEDLLAKTGNGFAILGTSMGGRLALETALAAPERVQALCVIGAGAGAMADASAGLQRSARIRSGENKVVVREMAEKIAHSEGPNGPATRQAFITMAESFDRQALLGQSEALAHRGDDWARLQHISCPALFLWGACDQFSSPSEGMRMAGMVKDGRYVELPACGHFPTLEYPERANAAIRAWLSGAGVI